MCLSTYHSESSLSHDSLRHSTYCQVWVMTHSTCHSVSAHLCVTWLMTRYICVTWLITHHVSAHITTSHDDMCWVMSHIYNESCHAYVMSNESCHTYMTSQVTPWYVLNHGTHMKDSCYTLEWVMAHTWMSHVTHMNEECHTHEWVMSHTWMSHVTHMNDSCHITICAQVIHAWHDSSYMCDMTHYICVTWLSTYRCVTWLVIYVWHDSWHMYDMTY